MSSPPNLRHLTPTQIIEAARVRLPRQMQRWLVRGDPADVIGVFPWAGEKAVFIRLRPKGRRPVYLALRQHGRRFRVDQAPAPDWHRMEPDQSVVGPKKQRSLDRLKNRLRERNHAHV